MAINTIGTVSVITDIHPSSLRRWESLGYVRPLRMFLSGASLRVYTDAQVELLKTVKGYLDEGYQLKSAFRMAKQDSERGNAEEEDSCLDEVCSRYADEEN